MANLPKLGQAMWESEREGHRDAFHVACVLVTAPNDYVEPGQCVRFCDNDFDTVESVSSGEDHCAVVDPFLGGAVTCGKAFWVFLLPGVYKNVTHTFDIDLDLDLDDEYRDNDDGGACRNCDS